MINGNNLLNAGSNSSCLITVEKKSHSPITTEFKHLSLDKWVCACWLLIIYSNLPLESFEQVWIKTETKRWTQIINTFHFASFNNLYSACSLNNTE